MIDNVLEILDLDDKEHRIYVCDAPGQLCLPIPKYGSGDSFFYGLHANAVFNSVTA